MSTLPFSVELLSLGFKPLVVNLPHEIIVTLKVENQVTEILAVLASQCFHEHGHHLVSFFRHLALWNQLSRLFTHFPLLGHYWLSRLDDVVHHLDCSLVHFSSPLRHLLLLFKADRLLGADATRISLFLRQRLPVLLVAQVELGLIGVFLSLLLIVDAATNLRALVLRKVVVLIVKWVHVSHLLSAFLQQLHLLLKTRTGLQSIPRLRAIDGAGRDVVYRLLDVRGTATLIESLGRELLDWDHDVL